MAAIMSALQHYVHQLENNVLEYCYCSVKIVFLTFDSEKKKYSTAKPG